MMVDDASNAAVYLLATVICILVLLLIARGLMRMARIVASMRIPFEFRLGISNLHRPNNQTTTLMLVFGLSIALLSTLFFVQDMLGDALEFSNSQNRSNAILFDIQKSQRDPLKKLMEDHLLAVKQDVPVVTMKLQELNGQTRNVALQEREELSKWIFDREYRVTFRDSLIRSEKLRAGKLAVSDPRGDQQAVYVSMYDEFAERNHFEIGDRLLFNIQGALVHTTIGSLRSIDWRGIQSNFILVFPENVLKKAPRFHIFMTRIEGQQQRAGFQNSLVETFPNISIIDITLVMKTLQEVSGKVMLVVRFLAWFSILTGLIVLAGSVVLSRFQRQKETQLLRILGASLRKLILLVCSEYLALSAMSCLAGLTLAMIGTWLIGTYVLKIPFQPGIADLGIIFGWTVVVITFLGISSHLGLMLRVTSSRAQGE